MHQNRSQLNFYVALDPNTLGYCTAAVNACPSRRSVRTSVWCAAGINILNIALSCKPSFAGRAWNAFCRKNYMERRRWDFFFSEETVRRTNTNKSVGECNSMDGGGVCIVQG